MGGDGEQRLGKFPDTVNVEVLQVLRGKNDSAFLLAYTLHKVSYILNGGGVGKEQVQLINTGNGISTG
ncbi:hypothetical protein Clo1100_3435 [Clostridium sp. BNL1100]|nr:hypothetical protein Clo1100_3435 [Clostridium sp. BNL1100]